MTNSNKKHLNKRHRANRRFRLYGLLAVLVSFLFLGTLLYSIISKGYTAFQQTEVRLPITFAEEAIDPTGERNPEVLAAADYQGLVYASLKERFPDVASRMEMLQLYNLVSKGAGFMLQQEVLANPKLIGTAQEVWLKASADVDMFEKGTISRDVEEARRKIKDKQILWLDALSAEGRIKKAFNTTFFTEGDSREPEDAGILGSVVGSLFTVIACMAVAFPLAVLTAVYLEEFAPKNKFTDFIEVNINNLAAVPSIVFGLLGLAVYLTWVGLPRSSSLVGGLTLALMVLPTIVITTRLSLRAVPPSIRDGARALGASPLQVVAHHTLPLAMPGIMTGTILSIARALGETAPLLMIGMVAFIADIPHGFTDPAVVMPVQVYLWADSPELAFAERTSAAIMVLLLFLIAMNALAVYLRKRFERRW